MRAMFDRIARRLRPDELGHDGRAAPPLARARRRPRARRPGRRARSTSPPARATWRSSWRAASAPGGEVVGTDFSEGMLDAGARSKAAGGRAGSGRNALTLPYADDELRRRDGRLRRAQLLRPRRGLAEMARVVRPGGRVVVLEITTPHAAAAVDLLLALVRPRRAGARAARRRPDAYTYLPSSVRRFPGPEALAARDGAARAARRPLDPHRGRHHRAPRRGTVR